MGDTRSERVEAVFAEALRRDSATRARYLDEACADDAALRAEVGSLLAHHDADSAFLPESPPAEAVATGPSAALGPGRLLGTYRIVDAIGEGGMGVVYRAQQEHPRRTVALKVIRPGWATRAMLDRFRHEANVLGRLHHPGIAQIFEAGTADTGAGEQPFFAMELVDGRPLLEHAREHELSLPARVELLVRICDAVQHAHQKGVIHRDLKPGNILVDGGGQPKVLDFGVARTTDADVRSTTLRTSVGQLVGTIAYMSPEQATGDPTQVDTRSDVYALGVVGYELLAGCLPYTLEDRPLHEAVRIVRETGARPLGTVDRRLRGDLETIVARALEKDRERRYPSASDLAADLRRSLRHEPIMARRASAIYQLRTFARRHVGLVASIATIMTLLVIGLVAVGVLALRLADQRDTAVRHQAAAETEAAKAKRINAVLLEMFAAVDPHVNGRDVKVVDVLAGAEAIVATELADQPEVAAAVRDTLGMTYVNLGLFAEAEPHLQAALASRRVVLGPDAPDTLRSELSLAVLRKEQGMFDEAELLYRHVLAGLEPALGVEHPDTLTARNNMAEVLKAQGRFAEAEPLYEQVLAVQRRALGDEHQDTLGTVNNRAGLLIDLGRLPEAEPLYRELVETTGRTLGAEHPFTLVSMNNLAFVVQEQGRLDEAAPLRQQVADVSRRVLSETHPRTIASISSYAVVLMGLDRADEAEPLFTEAIALAETHLPPDHWIRGTVRGGYGTFLTRQSRFADAEMHLLRSRELLAQTFGDDHPRTRTAAVRLVTLYEAWDRPDEAARYRPETAPADDR